MALQQPNFHNLNLGMQTVANELSLMQNVPQFQVQQQLTNLQQQLTNLSVTLTQAIQNGFAGVHSRLDSIEHNMTSRVLNSHVRNNTAPLYMIVDPQNIPVPNLPLSILALDQIENQGQTITNLLLRMGVPQNAIPNIVAQRFLLLKNKMGLPTQF